MTSRYNTVWKAPPRKAEPIKLDYELVSKIHPVSFNEDKSVKEYTEEDIFVAKKSKWNDYIKSFDIGSPSEQVLNHIKKGTPLITAHTLPHGDYTQDSLLKGAEILREMREKGITLEQLEEASKVSIDDASKKVVTPSPSPSPEVEKKEGE